jgi:hypothetical protein
MQPLAMREPILQRARLCHLQIVAAATPKRREQGIALRHGVGALAHQHREHSGHGRSQLPAVEDHV